MVQIYSRIASDQQAANVHAKKINQISWPTGVQELPSCLLNNAFRPRLASVSCLRGRPNVGLVSVAVVCAWSRWSSDISSEGSLGGPCVVSSPDMICGVLLSDVPGSGRSG